MQLTQKAKSFVHFLLAWGAYWRYGRPARKLIVVGVTGTKGKSSTCRFVASALEAGGYKVGLLSTVEFQIGERRWLNDKKMSMLGRGQIQRMFRQMVDAGCQYVVVETSSEGILQYRHYGLLYDITVFTNLGTEHSERHGGFENLRRDKGKMFKALMQYRKTLQGKPVKKIAIVNGDDDNAPFYLQYPADEKIVYNVRKAPPTDAGVRLIHGEVKNVLADGTECTINDHPVRINIVGDFNLYNALAAYAVAESQGVAPEKIAEGVAAVRNLPGRMEFVEAGQPYKIVVDYAHEPISYTALFSTLRKLLKPGNKLIAVIGSDGGGRDISKRGPMGEIAGKLADYVVVTDVNCFDDDPREIAEMLAVGARKAGKKDGTDLFIEVERQNGILQALQLAKPGDIVAITAKGTEPCIVVAHGKKIPWDDRQKARELALSLLK